MSDVFDEVSAELRRDRLMGLWQRHRRVLIAAPLVLVLAVGLFSGYHAYQRSQREAASQRFEALLAAPTEDKQAQLAALAAFAETEQNGYGVLADFRRAALLLAEKRNDDAVTIYDGIIARRDLPRAIHNIARLYAAAALLGRVKPEVIETRLTHLLNSSSPLRATAREIYGVALVLADKPLHARELFRAQLNDEMATPLARERVRVFLAEVERALGTP